MPSIPATEIVDKLFSGNKDLSSEVNDAMMAISAEKLEAEKKAIAANWLKPEEQPETEVTPDETDKGTD